MKVAFFCNYNKEFKETIKDLEKGNIGIGGTQYLFMLVVSNLQKKYNSIGDNYILLSNQYIKIDPDILKYKKVKDIKEAWKWCQNNNYDYLVIRANDIMFFSKKEIKESKVSFILWAHNYIGKKTEEILYNEEKVIKLICVSKQQYLNMSNSIAYKKMTYINNCIGNYIDYQKEIKHLNKNINTIYYIGAIEPAKGVHNVINIFNKVYKKNKNIKLVIIGGLGNLRAKDISLGKLDLTYPKYEKKLLSMIQEKHIEKQVQFLGVLDNKEIKKIVIDNPGIGLISVSLPLMGETFCMTALELESYGIPVVARKRNDGLNTVIKNKKTGYLEKTDRKITKRILEIINDRSLYKELSENAIKYSKDFSVTKIIDKWYEKLNEIGHVDQEFKNNIIYRIKDKIHYNFVTPREFILRLQTKIILERYKKWIG